MRVFALPSLLCLLIAAWGLTAPSPVSAATTPAANATRQPLPFRVEAVKPTPDTNEWDQPDLRGDYDSLLPVAADYPLPEVPSRLHDVATLRDGRYVRPRVPGYRTTADGRLGISLEADEGLHLVLFTPEKLRQHWTQMTDGSAALMGDHVVKIASTDLVPAALEMTPVMYAMCDTSHNATDNELYGLKKEVLHRNPVAVSDTADAYEFTVVSGVRYRSKTFRRWIGVTLRVVVEDAKTERAHITSVERVGEIIVANLPFQYNNLFEPTITGDGRLLVTRVAGTPGAGGGVAAILPKPWQDQTGLWRLSKFDMVYSYNDPRKGFAPCDPRGWQDLKPISYAHHDDAVRARYGFAKYPMRDPEGKIIPPGQDAGIMYPWIDSKGANIFFTSMHRFNESDEASYARPDDLDSLSSELPAFQAIIDKQKAVFAGQSAPVTANRPHLMLPAEHLIPVPGGCEDCENSTHREEASPTRGTGVFGLWTKGKMVLMDDLTNAVDLAMRGDSRGHKLARLYHGTGGVVRLGNGRTNVGLQKGFDSDSFWPFNDTIIDSLENKLNAFRHMAPADPHDVVWTINNGHASVEFAFDQYMDESALILSNMTPSMSQKGQGPIRWLVANTGDRFHSPLRVQNAATGTTGMVPAYGRVFGETRRGTRIEPVALGGIQGKGLWLDEAAGVAYRIPDAGAEKAERTDSLYAGLFVDPRLQAPDGERRLLTLPGGHASVFATAESRYLLLRDGRGWQARINVAPWFRNTSWTHLGLAISRQRIDVYINGFLLESLDKEAAPDALMLGAGDIVFGSPSSMTPGIRGWFDEFVVLARPLTSAEEACNLARGSMIRSSDPANKHYPASSHQHIAVALGDPDGTRYRCATHYEGEGYGFLTRIPESQRVGKALRQIRSLHFNQPRPDESQNAFCLVCHRADQASRSLQIDVLRPVDLPMQLDRRRQPMQPYPVVIGNIPAHSLEGPGGSGPVWNRRHTQPGEWEWIDPYLTP